VTVMRFGVSVSTSVLAGTDPVSEARAAEQLGFDFVSATDHPCGTDPTYETWTMLSWIAASTSRIGVMTKVLGVPYRPPAMTAKMAETLDRLSAGRLILGLGGGYSDEEFRAFGLGELTPREKVTGLEEAINITRGLWSVPRFSFQGDRYVIDGADLEPKPQRRIPIWLGTFGSRALALTGRLADGWIPSLGSAPPDVITAMRERVLNAAQEAGRQPDDITCAYHIQFRIGGNEKQPGIVSGSVAAVVQQLASFVKLGFTAMNFSPLGPDAGEQVHRLAQDVLPALRNSV